jgi:type V secretory pathway adhesin AidA
MQVDTEPFPMNMIDFEGKRILVRPNTTDKGKDKEIIIGNTREADENHKISCRKVVTEKTPDGGETLKVTITTSSAGGQAQTKGQEPVLRILDGLTQRRGLSETTPDGPENSNGRPDHTQDPQRPRTFKLRRPEIGTWKTNTFKAAGQLVKSGPTFDQLLSKYVKKNADPSDRPAKRPRSPIREQYQVRPIGPPHQSEKNGRSYCPIKT